MAADPIPGRLRAMVILGCIAGLGVGLVLSLSQGSPVWLFLAVVAVVVNTALFVRSRRRIGLTTIGTPTGTAVAPLASFAGNSSAQMQWVGGANMPGALGRMNATAPLGVLELAGTQLILRVRPRVLGSVFGVGAGLTAQSNDGLEVFPSRGVFRSPGVGLKPAGRPAFYFWTRRRSEVLTALASAGFNVSWDERRMRY